MILPYKLNHAAKKPREPIRRTLYRRQKLRGQCHAHRTQLRLDGIERVPQLVASLNRVLVNNQPKRSRRRRQLRKVRGHRQYFRAALAEQVHCNCGTLRGVLNASQCRRDAFQLLVRRQSLYLVQR